MTPRRSPVPRRRRALRAWVVSITATVATSYGLDLVATTCGVLLVAATGSTDPTRSVVVTALVASYLGWGVALRVYLYANLDLLEATGTSTSVFSKAAYDLAGRWTPRRRVQRTAATLGYLTTEVAMEVPYYAGAFGAAALSDTLTSDDALVFLTGTNLGAGLYVYGIARATRAFLARHPEQTVADPAGPEPTVTAAG